MAEEVECTITSLSRAISKLVKTGYVERDRSGVPGKKHLTVYRVFYDEAPVAQRDKYRICAPQMSAGETFARLLPENAEESGESALQEISLSEEIDLDESIGRNSNEVAHRRDFCRQGKGSGSAATARMSQFDRQFTRAPQSFSQAQLLEIRGYLFDIFCMGPGPQRQHATRLMDDIDNFFDNARMIDEPEG
jgi:hypothetical protein